MCFFSQPSPPPVIVQSEPIQNTSAAPPEPKAPAPVPKDPIDNGGRKDDEAQRRNRQRGQNSTNPTGSVGVLGPSNTTEPGIFV